MHDIVGKQAPGAYSSLDKQFIGGTWRPGRSGKTAKDTNPYNGEVLLSYDLASTVDLNDAYEAAKGAQRAWAATLPGEKAAVFRKAADIMEARKEEIVSWLIRESGSTRIKAEMEFGATLAMTLACTGFPYHVTGQILPTDVPGKVAHVYRQPLGVVGVISPWNWPLYLTHRSVAAALAVGNGVVVKPADDTPVTGGLLMAAVLEEAGLPAGLLNVVVGDLADVGDQFTLHPIPRMISFTGSTRVGKHIGEMANGGEWIKKVALELGGNAPFVVLDDADIDQAVKAAVFGRFAHQGQICMSTNRIIVDDKIYDEFAEKFVAHVKGLKVGDPNDPDTAIGPLINHKQFDGAMKRIEAAKAEGLKLAVGGEAHGQSLPPHVFLDVKNSDSIAQEEQFAPIVGLIRAKDEADALRIANETQYGLSSAVFSKDEGRAIRFALQVEAGMTHINDQSVNDAPNNPFGGEKNSGIGRFGAEWIIAEFTTDHLVTVQHEPRAYPF